MAVTRAMRHATGSKESISVVRACRLHRTVWREWQNTQHVNVDRRRGINDGNIGKISDDRSFYNNDTGRVSTAGIFG